MTVPKVSKLTLLLMAVTTSNNHGVNNITYMRYILSYTLM